MTHHDLLCYRNLDLDLTYFGVNIWGEVAFCPDFGIDVLN